MNIVKKGFSLKKICTLMMSFFMVFTLVASNSTFASKEDEVLPMGILYLDYFMGNDKCRCFNGAKPINVEIVGLEAFEEVALKRSSRQEKLDADISHKVIQHEWRPIASIKSHELMRLFYIGDMIIDEIEPMEKVCPTKNLLLWLHSILEDKGTDDRQFGQEYDEEYTIKVRATLKDCNGVEFKEDFAYIKCYSKSSDAKGSDSDSDEDTGNLEPNAHYNSEDSDTDSYIAGRNFRRRVKIKLAENRDRIQRDLAEIGQIFKRLR